MLMERTTKKAADAVNRHREDGEEAIKRTSKVVPMDAGRNSESVQVATHSRFHLETKSVRRKRASNSKRANRQR